MNPDMLTPFGLKIRMPSRREDQLPSLASVLQLVRHHRVVLIRGVDPLSRERLIHYCKGSNPHSDPFLHWDFGPVMELQASADPKNYLFSREAVPFHWDGAFHRVPSILVFNCIAEPATDSGGETLFCDTTRLWNQTPPLLRSSFSKIKLTYRTERLAHYGGEVTVPLVNKHPHDGTPVLRFAEEVKTTLNPVSLNISGVSPREAFETLDYLTTHIYQKDFCLEHQWQRGDLLFADNHALIHGRRAFLQNSPRHIRRVQLL